MSSTATDGRGQRGKEHAAEIEQYTIEQIPLDQRHGKPRDLFTIWFTSNLMPLTIVTGALATAVFGLNFWSALVAIVVGNLIGAVFMALHSAQGPKLGIPQMIQSRAQYGVLGSILVVGIVVFMYVGFFASNLILGGQAINQVTSSLSVNWGIVICAVISLLVVIWGYDLIHFVNRWMAWVFTVVMTVATIYILSDLPHGFLSKGSFSWGGFISAMVVTGVLWQIAYAPYVSDYSRYMAPEAATNKVFWNSYWGVVIGSTLPMLLGAVVGIISADSQVSAISTMTKGFSVVVMLVFAVGIMNTNVLNAYGGVLCAITVGQNFKSKWFPGARARGIVAAVFVAICLWLALVYASSFLTSFFNFMLFLLYLLVPWTLINLIDFYLVQHGQYDVPAMFAPDGGPYGRFNWGTIAIYLIGFAVEVPFVNTTFYEGPAAKALNGTDYSWLIAMIVVAPLYYWYAMRRRNRLVPVASVTPATAAAPEGQ
jgi:nucleobase:cation symporter-1, NCS1 family